MVFVVPSIHSSQAAFWISWRLFREFVGQPNKKELHKSNPEVTNAQSSLSASLRQDVPDFNNITQVKEGGPRNLSSVH